jgi:hypothetical protein
LGQEAQGVEEVHGHHGRPQRREKGRGGALKGLARKKRGRDVLVVERRGHGAMQWYACPCGKIWKRWDKGKRMKEEKKSGDGDGVNFLKSIE